MRSDVAFKIAYKSDYWWPNTIYYESDQTPVQLGKRKRIVSIAYT